MSKWLPLDTALNVSGYDPYLRWAAATDFRDYVRAGDRSDRITVSLELLLGDKRKARAFTDALKAPGTAGTLRPAYVAGKDKFVVGSLAQAAFATPAWEAIHPLIVRMNLAMDLLPQRARRRKPSASTAATATVPKSTSNVLVGIIDTHFAFAHRELRGRVLRLWDQDPTPALGALAGGQPAKFGYGREVGRSALRKHVRRFTDSSGRVDEDACYEACGYRELRARFAHGTAVASQLVGRGSSVDLLQFPASLAAGPGGPSMSSRAPGVPVAADLVLVQLPRDAVQDGAGHGMAAHVLDGLRYIVGCAGPATRRIVVNLSYAVQTGPHDGTSMLEAAIDDFVSETEKMGLGLDVVLPTGNTFLDRCHVKCAVDEAVGPAAFERRLTLDIPPANEVASFIEFWLPSGGPTISFELLTPDGNGSGPLAAGESGRWPDAGLNAVPARAAVICDDGASRGGSKSKRRLVLVSIAPTLSMDRPDICAPSGRWTVVLRSSAPSLQIEGWIAFNQRNTGAVPRGLQARFVDARWDPKRHLKPARDDEDPSCPIRRRGSTSGIGGGKQTTLVAGTLWRGKEQPVPGTRGSPRPGRAKEHAPYSGAFEDTGVSKSKKFLSASCEESWALEGIPTSGSRSGIAVRARGTSFSCPQVARKLAEGSLGTPQRGVVRQGLGGLGNIDP